VDGEKVVEQEIVFNEFGRVRDVVLGPDGYLYVALSPPGQRMSDNTAGFVLRLVPVDPPKN
jgi:glucose/arabinose dehydrogenase